MKILKKIILKYKDMKAKTIKLILLSFLFLNISLLSYSQKNVNNEIIKQERELPEFNEIYLTGITKVYLNQGDEQKVVVEASAKVQDRISTQVKNNKLKITSKFNGKQKQCKIYVTVKEIKEIQISGAAFVKGIGNINAPELRIIASGASDVNLKITVDTLYTNLSGASNVILSGNVYKHLSKVSGAATLKAANLITQKTNINASGAANAKVFAEKELNEDVSGAANVNNIKEVKVKENKSESQNIGNVHVNEDGDTTIVNIGNIKIEVVDGDSTKISFGNKLLEVSADGDVNFKKIRRKRERKFKGHWAGFEMGVNGYLYDNDFTMTGNYDFLELKYEKSSCVNINFLEQNFNIYRNHLGLTTGLGLQFINYRFSDNVILTHNNEIGGFKDINPDRNYSKSKLVVNYLTLPLLLEYQTNRFSKANSFHISAGMILATRIGSHSKVVYNDGGKHKDKDRDSFYLNPFKYDATVRIGWGVVNVFATYSVNTLFKTDKGPEVYPFSVGLTLCNW